MIARRVLFGPVTALVVCVGCGDLFLDPEVAQVESADAAVDGGGATFPEDVPTQCPSFRPRENSSCAVIGSSCEYGTSADARCNAGLVCRGASINGAWESSTRGSCFESMCPTATRVDALDNTPCSITDGGASDDEAVCNMLDGVCACTTGHDGISAHERKWVCVRPITACPTKRPLAGTPCAGEAWCDYGSCAFKRGLLMECRGGVWLAGGAPCQ